MKTTRPVFESFSEFVDFLGSSLFEAEITSKTIQEIWDKSDEIYQKLGPDFDKMAAKWKLAAKKEPMSSEEMAQWAGSLGAIYSKDNSQINLQQTTIAKFVQDGKKYSKFDGMSLKVTPFSYENAIGPKANSTFSLAKKGKINIYETINCMNMFNTASFLTGVRTIINSGNSKIKYDELKDDTFNGGNSRGEKRDTVNSDAEKGYWWPSLFTAFKHEVFNNSIVLTGDKSSISPAEWTKKVGSITGLAPDKDQDLAKQELTFKCVFYSVDSIELGTGTPRTSIEEKTVEIPTVEKSESNVTKYESVPTPSGLFAAGKSVPVQGKENIVVAALNTIFSQFISVESVEVQGSTSWEWESDKRNDEKNNALGKARAEYFVKVINAGAGKEIAKIGSTSDFPSNVIQPKDKEKEDLSSWRKVNLKITGTKLETKETPKIIFKVEEEEVVLRRDKINMTEYVVNWTVKSGSKVIKKEGWGN
jgi:hypothetical protein